MKENILLTLIEEANKLEIIDGKGRATGTILIDDCISLLEKLEVAMLSQCDAEVLQAQLDRERFYKQINY